MPTVLEWHDGGQDCPTGEGKWCLNGNTAYSTFEEAWEACGRVAQCKRIMKHSNDEYFLRRADDPVSNLTGQQTLRYLCKDKPRYTFLTEAVQAGATTLRVDSTEGMNVGDDVVLTDATTGTAEISEIAGFAYGAPGIVLSSPVLSTYDAGTTVKSVPHTTTSSTTTATTTTTIAPPRGQFLSLTNEERTERKN